jgi:hypothetical protein
MEGASNTPRQDLNCTPTNLLPLRFQQQHLLTLWLHRTSTSPAKCIVGVVGRGSADNHLHDAELEAELFDVAGRRLVAMAWRLVVGVGWRRCCLEDCWECFSSLELAPWGVLFIEARWSQTVSWSDWFPLSFRQPAPIADYIAPYRTCRTNTRTALLKLYLLTCPSHLDNWSN